MELKESYIAGSFEGPEQTWEVTDELVQSVMTRVLRNDFTQPGVALLDGGTTGEPRAFREFLWKLVQGMDAQFQKQHNKKLWMVSAVHMNQKYSTQAHIDAGPAEGLLILGYEPTAVKSQICVTDYIQYAQSIGQPVPTFLREYPSKHQEHLKKMVPFTTELLAFQPDRYQVVIFNNSSLTLESCKRGMHGMLGVMHQASIDDQADEKHERIINSIMLGVASLDALSLYGDDDLQKFIEGQSYSYGYGN